VVESGSGLGIGLGLGRGFSLQIILKRVYDLDQQWLGMFLKMEFAWFEKMNAQPRWAESATAVKRDA